MKRHGSVIRRRPEHEEEYLRLHRAVWPAVLEQITRSGIGNYLTATKRRQTANRWTRSTRFPGPRQHRTPYSWSCTTGFLL
ncbi:L-rhamnose mutarotase [Arthrobacter pascens]|uniref:L-rhamnose mutarotase n=1 Tax=Arthrobacter pascens TaxID=1677 RepID=UPI0027D85384|nr:L-rhamnose mutarotase [Arthrobacter pascens]